MSHTPSPFAMNFFPSQQTILGLWQVKIRLLVEFQHCGLSIHCQLPTGLRDMELGNSPLVIEAQFQDIKRCCLMLIRTISSLFQLIVQNVLRLPYTSIDEFLFPSLSLYSEESLFDDIRYLIFDKSHQRTCTGPSSVC